MIFYIKNTPRSTYQIDTKMEQYNLKNYLINTGQDCTQEGSTQHHWKYFYPMINYDLSINTR